MRICIEPQMKSSTLCKAEETEKNNEWTPARPTLSLDLKMVLVKIQIQYQRWRKNNFQQIWAMSKRMERYLRWPQEIAQAISLSDLQRDGAASAAPWSNDSSNVNITEIICVVQKQVKLTQTNPKWLIMRNSCNYGCMESFDWISGCFLQCTQLPPRMQRTNWHHVENDCQRSNWNASSKSTVHEALSLITSLNAQHQRYTQTW